MEDCFVRCPFLRFVLVCYLPLPQLWPIATRVKQNSIATHNAIISADHKFSVILYCQFLTWGGNMKIFWEQFTSQFLSASNWFYFCSKMRLDLWSWYLHDYIFILLLFRLVIVHGMTSIKGERNHALLPCFLWVNTCSNHIGNTFAGSYVA